MNQKKISGGWKRFSILYTVLFALLAAVIFRYFPMEGKNMVWKGDGLSQHFTALCYYARWGRAVLRSLVSGHPSFPTFNMHMGLGSDLFTTLQYYVIGDPFSLPAVLVPQRHMLVFHDAMILDRLYIAGLCFDGYCRCMGRRDLTGNLCGSLVYVFGSFGLFGIRHPYFLNAMIWFPLLLTGAEHIFRGRRGRLFTVAVFLSCVSNFYFFYMLVIMTVIYAVWRALRLCLFPAPAGAEAQRSETGTEGKGAESGAEEQRSEAESDGQRSEAGTEEPQAEIGTGGRKAGQVRACLARIFRLAAVFLVRACLGTAMGACFLVPILLRFGQDPRASEGAGTGLFYAVSYYKSLPEAFVAFGTDATLDYWTCLGFGGIGLISVLLLFLDGEKDRDGRGSGHFDLKLAFAGMAALVMIPAAGAALNGFSYPSNRWIWAFAMLTGYITAVMVPSLRKLSAKKALALAGGIAVYAGICAGLGAAKSTLAELGLTLAAAAVVLICSVLGGREKNSDENRNENGGKSRGANAADQASVTGRPDIEQGSRGRQARLYRLQSAVLAGLILVTGLIHGYVEFIPGRMNSALREYHSRQYIEAMKASDAAGVRSLVGDGTFFRYSGRDLANNFSILHDVSNTQYYWSLSDGGIERFFTETGQGNGMVHLYDNLDNRTFPDELAGVRYYTRSDGSLLPFGYEKLEGLHYDNRELFEEKEGDPLPVFSFSLYENRYALPLGFTSANYISRETYEALSIPQRQEALMQGILLEEEDLRKILSEGKDLQGTSPEAADLREMYAEKDPEGTDSDGSQSARPNREEGQALSFTSREIPFAFQAEEGINVASGPDGSVEIRVGDPEAVLTLDTEDTAGTEVSVLLTGTDYEPPADGLREDEVYSNTDPVEIRVKAKRDGHTVSTKKVEYTLEDNPWKTGREDFLSCCGWSEESLSELRLSFSRRGTYRFRELKVIGQAMDAYPAYVEELGAYTLEDLDLHELAGSGATDRITGRITLPGTRILCLQIPRCRGLRAYVDGVERPLLQADTMFSALVVEAGTHEIELRYATPGLIPGAVLSVLALLLFAADAAAGRRRRRGSH
ncbi:MAG: hypothetical protein E7238_02900 [Sarcina sp.]|nr:hypothetical protein [Sarcina sp.]